MPTKMPLRPDAVLTRWHKMLNLQRQIPACWHRARLREELHERSLATTRLARVSETSDVLFTISRAAHDGFPVRKRPPFAPFHNGLAYVYMFAKYTSRWGFYRMAALLSGAPDAATVREVVNPAKDSKLDEVAVRHGIDLAVFRRVGRRLRCVWPLLP